MTALITIALLVVAIVLLTRWAAVSAEKAKAAKQDTAALHTKAKAKAAAETQDDAHLIEALTRKKP